jgi:hypothetical protein
MNQKLRRSRRWRLSSLMVIMLAPPTGPTARNAISNELPRENAACRYGDWPRATWIERVGSLLTATRFPTVAVSRERGRSGPLAVPASVGYAVGVVGFVAITPPKDSAREAQWPPALRAIRFDGERFDRPGDGFWYAYPRAVADDSGTLHVVWAEPEAKLPARATDPHGDVPELRSVWYSTLRGGRWSRAERIYQGRRLEWDETRTSRLIVDAKNGLHVAFGSLDPLGYRLISLSAANASRPRWRSSAIRARGGMSYLDLAIGPSGGAAIAFVTATAVSSARVNVLALTRSNDGGTTWTEPAVISEPDEEPAIEPHLFFDQGAALRAEWAQQHAETFVGGRIFHTAFAGLDRHSTSSIALPRDVMTSHSQAAIDSCGTLHVMTQAYPREGVELRYARLANEEWSTWVRPFDVGGGHASIVASRGLVHVVWQGSAKSGSPDGRRYGLAHSALPIVAPEEPRPRE